MLRIKELVRRESRLRRADLVVIIIFQFLDPDLASHELERLLCICVAVPELDAAIAADPDRLSSRPGDELVFFDREIAFQKMKIVFQEMDENDEPKIIREPELGLQRRQKILKLLERASVDHKISDRKLPHINP